jgi:hypothetical protein
VLPLQNGQAKSTGRIRTERGSTTRARRTRASDLLLESTIRSSSCPTRFSTMWTFFFDVLLRRSSS